MTAALAAAAEAEGGEVGVARRNNDVSLTLWRGQNEVVRRRAVVASDSEEEMTTCRD